MDTILIAGLSNAAWSAALAVAAAIAARIWRHRPALVHVLWLLVLLKLLTPSLVHVRPKERAAASPTTRPADPRQEIASRWPDGPHGTAPEPPAATTRPSRIPGENALPKRDRAPARRPWPWKGWVAAAWLAGAAAWWSAVGLGVSRFRRLLRSARPAPEALCRRVDRVAALLGLRRSPAVWVVPARIPPMLWALVGPPRLLLPEELWGRLGEAEQDSVLAHELAHLKRRDDRVRRLEAVVLGLFWWDPVAWWARREVERAEELCCDAWVLWALPGSAAAYAEALVATAAFLSGPRPPRPVGAMGAGRLPPLKRRLTMILRDSPDRSMPRHAPRALLILAGLALTLLPVWALGDPQGSTRPDPAGVTKEPLPAREGPPGLEAGKVGAGRGDERRVKVSQPIVREVGAYVDFSGRVEAGQTVELRARVSGMLDQVRCRPGMTVEKGDLLFEIDSRTYSADLARAEAEVRGAEARLKRSSADLERSKSLRSRNSISQEELNRIEGTSDEAEASLQAARASLELAAIKLGATRVTAPIGGKISRAPLSTGNLVVADTTPLATIVSLDPMHVAFDVDERTALRLNRQRRERKVKADRESKLTVLVGLADEEGFPHRSEVDAMDAGFDPATGTTRWRAAVPNPDGILAPGLFARVRLVTGAPSRALLVAEDAVLSDRGRTYVFVVGDRGVVERRPVHFGGFLDGLRAVKEGLKEDEWVVVEGLEAVESGVTVKPEKVTMPARSSTPRDRPGH